MNKLVENIYLNQQESSQKHFLMPELVRQLYLEQTKLNKGLEYLNYTFKFLEWI
jgi:hypothetical protein